MPSMIETKTNDRIIQPKVDKIKFKSLAVLALIVLLSLEGKAVLDAMQRSLHLCAGTIIPALFPYLAASELLVSSGAGERLARKISAPIRALFGISPCGAVVYFMGLLCGFPVGASMAAAYVRRGKLSRQEQEHLLCFCNVPSAAFVVNAVGVSLYGNLALGWRLWGISLISAALVGVGYRCLFHRRSAELPRETAPEPIGLSPRDGNPLSRAAMGMLSVVSTVLFFGALLGALHAAIQRVVPMEGGALANLSALLSAVLEMSSGVCAIAALPQVHSVVLCAAALGWGGWSVQYQLLSASGGTITRRGKIGFLIARLAQAALCATGAWLWIL